MVISCNNVKKSYGIDVILQKINLELPETGLFLLMGESGSGKTTLLNILYGLTDFEQGTVCIDGQSFSKKVGKEAVKKIGYLLQDSYFVEYLTVRDNLLLAGGNKEDINKMAEHFHLKEQMEKYPAKLSGGQKQRASLLRLLLMKKKILLLDEPTSSIGREEKIKTFQLLMELSQNHLILCATHDESMLEIADGYISPGNEWKLRTVDSRKDRKIPHKFSTPISFTQSKTFTNPFALLHYLTKHYRYPEREKKSGIFMTLVFFCALAAVYYVSDFQSKLEQTINNRYELNGLEIGINVDKKSECQDILKEAGAKEILFNYGRNLPAEDMIVDELDENNAMAPEFSYVSNLNVFPADRKNFPYQNAIIEGSYFTGKKQVILSKEYAQENYLDKTELIGSQIDLELPDGKDSFQVVGILDTEQEEVKAYFSNIFKVNTGICINGAYLDKYFHDAVIGEMEASQQMLSCMVYFSDCSQAQNFQTEYEKNENFLINGYENANAKLRIDTAGNRMYAIPVVCIAILVCMIFYFQTRQMEMAQNRESLSVYLYCGYSRIQLLTGIVLFYLRDLALRYLIAVLLTIGAIRIFEWFNTRFYLTEFTLFTFDAKNTIQIGLLLCFIGVLLSVWVFFTIHLKGWYYTLNQQRDIL